MEITLKGIIFEDFVNYKKPCMTLEFPYCTFKCGSQLCQNIGLAPAPNIQVNLPKLIDQYLSNPITEAVCFQGLEPFDSWTDVYNFVTTFRWKCQDDIVIYSGYTKKELEEKGYIGFLKKFNNIIIKYGRYLPDQQPHYDEVLGVNLVSENQYAERLSGNSEEM